MCQLTLLLEQSLIERIAIRPRMKWQWVLKMAQRGWIDEFTSDHAAKLRRRAEHA